jgi:hypothetical protein
MSALIVTKTIDAIARKPLLKREDVQQLIVAAERSEKGRPDGVSNAEAREIQLFVAKNKQKLEPEAVNAVNAFMMRHNLPYEANRGPMKGRMNAVLAAREGLGEPLTRQPRTGSLQPVRLTDVDEQPEKLAYYDVVKKSFVVKLEGQFYGPFPLDAQT